jgi:4-hydroxy-tetrahydrodipicolinate synthase
MTKWNGVFTFPVTCFDESGQRLDLGAFRENVEYQLQAGVHHVVPLGSTGEFAYLTADERRRVVEATVDQVRGRVPVIPGVSAITTAQAMSFAEEAREMGADAVLLILQTYFPLTDDQVIKHVAAVAEAARLPVFIYNNPGTSKVDFDVRLARRLVEVKGVAGLKESSGDVNRINLLHQALGGQIEVLAGWDTVALPSFALGCRAWCSGLPNVAPHQCVELYELAVERGDWEGALQRQRRLFPLAELLLTNQLAVWAKAGMELAGRRAGPPRAPLTRPNPQQLEELRRAMELAGLIPVAAGR